MTPRELAHASGAELRRLRDVLHPLVLVPSDDATWTNELTGPDWTHILESIGEDAARDAFFAGLAGEEVPK